MSRSSPKKSSAEGYTVYVPTLVEPDDPELEFFVHAGLGISLSKNKNAVPLAFRDKEGILGAAIYERYTGPGGSVHIHWTGRGGRWLTRDMIAMTFVYPFVQLQVKWLFGEVPAKDTYVRNLDERLGFEYFMTIPEFFPDDDLIIYRMHRDKCRWICLEEGENDGEA